MNIAKLIGFSSAVGLALLTIALILQDLIISLVFTIGGSFAIGVAIYDSIRVIEGVLPT